MKIDTNKMIQSGSEINRLATLIENNVVNYYNILSNISNNACTGNAADKYVDSIMKGKSDSLELIKCLKQEGNMIIDFASKIESKINSMKR